MAYASSDDVQSRLGRLLTADETPLVTARLADVERLIERGLKRRGLTTLAARITADLTDVEDVNQVESDVVLRLVRNPGGYYSETDGNYSYQFSQEAASGKLEILPEDWETLGVYDASGFFVMAHAFGVC